MNMTPHFKDITPEVYGILDELCALNLSDKQMNDTLSLIRRMTELGASDKQIWEAILLYSNTEPNRSRHYHRLIYTVKISSVANRDFYVEKQLLRNPKKVTELITGKARFVFSFLANFHAENLAKENYDLDPNAITSPTFDVWIQEIYNDYAPWMKESCFWETFNRSLQSMAIKPLTMSVPDTKICQSQANRHVYLFINPSDEDYGFFNPVLSDANTFGAEVAEIRDHIYLRAHAGDEDMFERWVSMKTAEWRVCRKSYRLIATPFRPLETQWKYLRCNFLNVNNISNRLYGRVSAAQYERFDVAPGQEIASINERCDDRLF